MTEVLNVQGLSVSYGDVQALRGLNFSIGRGQVCAIVGMNGSGKSTFFNSIMGLVPHQSGTIEVCGMPGPQARKAGLVGYVPQSEDVDKDFPISVSQVVMMGRYGKMGPLRRAHDADRQAVAAALDVVGLTELAHRPIGALSGGQRKRAFVARAVAQGAQLMLLDEPFAGVDYTSEEVIIELLKKLAKQGTTLLVSTHDLASIHTFADEVALLNRKIHMVGKPEEVLKPENLRKAFTEVAK